MKKKIRENAKKYFEEELSGEPLYQDLVIDWLTDFAEQQVKLFSMDNVSGLLPTPKQAEDLSNADWDKTSWQYGTCDGKTIYSWGFQNGINLCRKLFSNNR